MSTYYYIACKECDERLSKIAAVTRITASHLDNQNAVLAFLLKHQNCNGFKFFSEYDDEWMKTPTAETEPANE